MQQASPKAPAGLQGSKDRLRKGSLHSALIAVLLGGCSKSEPVPAPAPVPTTLSAVPVVASSALAAPSAPAKTNVLLITIDSLRADMPWNGYARPIAPNLKALHDKSVAYDNAYSTSSFTSKSIPGLLTGRYPSELARTGVFFSKYLDPDQFACTRLATQGIPCVGAHAHAYFGPGQSGFENGFSSWKIVSGITFDYQTDPYVTSDKLTPLAIETLGAVAAGPQKPFFAWFHYMDPHDEYKTHEESPHFGKKARDLYDEEVFFTDLWVGKLLAFVEQQPWAKETLIIVSADHGEAFGEHGISRHAHEVWEELVHVPLFFYRPGIKPRAVAPSRGAADIMPTIVDYLGAKVDLPGTSLRKEIEGGGAEPDRDVIVDLPEDDYNERRRALIHGRTKIIAFGNDVRFGLYDLASDPAEKEDLVLKKPELAGEMKQRYKDANKKIIDVAPRGGIPKHDPK